MMIFQKPNLILIIAGAGYVTSKIPAEIVHRLGNVTFTIAIIAWAYEELVAGVNIFRKLLGAAVLEIIFYSLFSQLR